MKNQLARIAGTLRRERSRGAKVRKSGCDTAKKIHALTKRTVLDLSVTLPEH